MINIYNISGTLISGGLEPEKTSANLKRDLTPSLGWTKSDMRHPHKVTTQMKPLPELEIIPPFSAENKEADVDREKRKMLTNNVSMMQKKKEETNDEVEEETDDDEQPVLAAVEALVMMKKKKADDENEGEPLEKAAAALVMMKKADSMKSSPKKTDSAKPSRILSTKLDHSLKLVPGQSVSVKLDRSSKLSPGVLEATGIFNKSAKESEQIYCLCRQPYDDSQ